MTNHEGHPPTEAPAVAPANSTADPTTVGRYRKKPVVIEAVQWDGTAEGAAPIIDWILSTTCVFGGDWIIRSPDGAFHTCTPNAFAATYDACDGAE